MTALRRLRLGVLCALALLVAVGLPERWIDGRSEGQLALPPPLEVRADAPILRGEGNREVGEPTWTALRRHAAESPLRVQLTGAPPALQAESPPRLRAGREGTLRLWAHEPTAVWLEDPDGLVQESDLVEGGSEAFLLEPRTEGWASWTLSYRTAAATALGDGGRLGEPQTIDFSRWVEPQAPLRILVLSGPPGQESQLAMRALEEAGEGVDAWVHLGRDLWIGREPGPLPDRPDAYREFDLVILFPGLSLTEGAVGALLGAVRGSGLGLLLAGTDGDRSELLRGISPGLDMPLQGVPVRGDTLSWELPLEISPLPPEELEAELRIPVGEDGMALRLSSPLVLSPLGRGRIGFLSLTDTWRWRMQAGAMEGHRGFWHGTAGWLTGGLAHDPVLEVLGAEHRVGDPVLLRWVQARPYVQAEEDGPATFPVSRVRITGPVGVDTLELPPVVWGQVGGTTAGRFLPRVAGRYHLEPMDAEGDGRSPGVGVLVKEAEEPGLDSAGRLARLALASPEGSVRILGSARNPGDDRWVEEMGSDLLLGILPRSLLPGLLLALLATALVVEWGFRRRWGWP